MLETLLESRSKGDRSTAGAIASVITHTGLIAAALYATAQARVQAAPSVETVRPVYFPQPTSPVHTRQPTPILRRFDGHRMIFVGTHIDIAIPAIDIGVVSKPGDFSQGTLRDAGSDVGERRSTDSSGSPFRADQVEKQVGVIPGSAPPRYPETLRAAGIEGKVIVEFVVDEQGGVVEGSVRVVHSDNALFEYAARVALGRMRFIPAEVGGKKVKQLVQMPFVFTLNR
jgi:protein TonB